MYRVLAALLCLAGCGPERTPNGTLADPILGSLAPVCTTDSEIPAVLDCAFTSETAGHGTVEYWLVEEPSVVKSTPSGPTGTEHDLSVLGLKAGRTYEYRAVLTTETGTRTASPVAAHQVPEVPSDFADLNLSVRDPERSQLAGGFLIVAIAHITDGRFSEVIIVDGDGDVVWWVRSIPDGLSISPTLSADGQYIRFLTSDQLWEDDLATVTRYRLDGREASLQTRALLGHHAMIDNSDDTLSWLSFTYATVDARDWAGDAIRTVAEGSGDETEPVLEFNWFDAYGAPPWEDVPGQSDPVRYGEGIEWTHSNSLMAVDDDYFYVSAKNLDKLIKVDRSDGSIEWQMNGLVADPAIPHFTHPDGGEVWRSVSDLDLWSHSHMSHLWDGGMVVFDNGDLSNDPNFSRAVEYSFDEQALTVEQVWEYVEPARGHTGAMGDVRKLESGNYVIAWSSLEYVNEVTPEGDTVWQLEMSGVGTFGRVIPLEGIYPPVVRLDGR
jgi:arylsulfate sulfotransferase